MKPSRMLLYLCFFVSGASALMYEIVWQRLLTLVFGVSTISSAAVLAAFLAGLAVGARLFGGLVDRARSPLRVYAGIEIGIAVAGLLSSLIVGPLMSAFTSLHQLWAPGWFLSNVIRFALAFASYGVPSMLIGATVPAMARLLAHSIGSLEVGFGRFYAVNTAGSVFGAAFAGFWIIPRVGTDPTLIAAVVGNVAVAAVAMLMSLRSAGPATPAGGKPAFAPPPAPADVLPTARRLAHGLAAMTGATALAYEVAWLRLMAAYTLNSVYVFTMVVTVYLAALALGAALAARVLRRSPGAAARWVVGIQIILAVVAPVTLALAPQAVLLRIDQPGLSESSLFAREYLLAVVMAFAPTVLIGMTLPMLAAMLGGRADHAGREVGRLYAWNSLGTIAGAVLTGVVLIPLVGLRGTFLLLAAGNLLIATLAALASPQAARLRNAPAFAAVGVVLVLAFLPADVRFYRPSGHKSERVLYYAEGPSAIVHVSEISDEGPVHRRLYVDSEGVAGTYPEIVLDQKLTAHLPVLMHPAPKHVLSVGFGTGGTSYSMLQHGIRVDCVEIEPRVPDAHELFRSENHGLVGPDADRPNFRLIIDDARAWLHVASRPYDVIVTDMTSIQYRGNGNLFTVEYFELMASRLAPGGRGCAWVPIEGVTPEQLKILFRSFQRVFPYMSVWYVLNMPTDFVILVGSAQPSPIDLERIREGMVKPFVARDLAEVHITDPRHLLMFLLIADDDVRAYTGPGELHTDRHPVLDYMTHASRYQQTLGTNVAEMLAHRTEPCAAAGLAADPECTAWSAAALHVMQGHVLSLTRRPEDLKKAADEYAAAEAALTGYRLYWPLTDPARGGDQ